MNKFIAKIIRKFGFQNHFKWLNDKTYLEYVFYDQLGYKLNLDNPQTFNEKLQWLKLYNRKSDYTEMVDKYAVKEYVKSKIGSEFLIKTIGVWDNVYDIDFQKLPKQFVMKCTHDSGCVIICKDKSEFNFTNAINKLHSREIKNFYYGGREWPYKNVKPRIIVEEYLVDKKNHDLRDYKFFVFSGKVKFFKVDFNRFVEHRANYYDLNGNILEFGEDCCPPNFNIELELPKTLNKMITLAEKLGESMPFVRIDFYEVEGKIYFGEITFFPDSGFGHFTPKDVDLKIGELLELPSVTIEE